MTVKLIQGDCFHAISRLADKSVDIVFTDPPYNATDLDFDDYVISDELNNLFLQKTKDNGYLVVFGMFNMFCFFNRSWQFRFDGVWIKPRGNPRTHSAKKPMNQKELFAVFAHPQAKTKDLCWEKHYVPGEPYIKTQKNTGYRRKGKDQLSRSSCEGWTIDGYKSINSGHRQSTDVLFGPQKSTMIFDERTPHPTQKPLKVLMTIIYWLTKEGDTILDPFMGSGTTGVAAQRMGRNFIGIEIDPEYYRMAKDRIENDQPLFNAGIGKLI